MQIRDMRHATGVFSSCLDGHAKGNPTSEMRKPQNEKKTPKQCGCCGLVHGNGQNCPAFGKKCMKCQKMNHVAAVCRTKSDNGKVEKKNNLSLHGSCLDSVSSHP